MRTRTGMAGAGHRPCLAAGAGALQDRAALMEAAREPCNPGVNTLKAGTCGRGTDQGLWQDALCVSVLCY
jgi:hypothetical protein